jgi:hypothetical protein
VRGRVGGPLAPHGRPGARLPRHQGGVVRGRVPARGPLPRRALRRPGPRPVHGPAAAAGRVHPGEAHGRLPGGRGRGQPGPAGAPGGARLGLGAVLGVRHRRAHGGPDRLLHVDVRAVPRPLRALDQQAPDPAHPAPRRPTPRPGRQVLVRVPAAHARAARTRLARPPGQALAEDPGTRREDPARRLPDLVTAPGRGQRRLAVPGQRAGEAAQATPGRLRARARAARHAPGGRVSLREALRRTGAVGTGGGAPHAPGQALDPAHPPRSTGVLDHGVRDHP